MTSREFDYSRALKLKEEARKCFAAKPIEEKCRILDELRAASVALRAAGAELRGTAKPKAKPERT